MTLPLRALFHAFPPESAADSLLVDFFLSNLPTHLPAINSHLSLRSFLVGYAPSIADFSLLAVLPQPPQTLPHLARWHRHISTLTPPVPIASLKKLLAQKPPQKPSDEISLELPGAVHGQVVTRFPPEPSGYLHIGHAKAALLNDFFAKQYNGRLLLRFDDTNPSKEKLEFEQSISQDLELLGIHPHAVSHTSDHFDHLYSMAIRLINLGKAYVDDTDQETMRNERFHGIESKSRNLSVQENLDRFEQMRIASPAGLTFCLRAKIDMHDKNKAMRDPVIYRTNLTPHHATGTAWNIYPTYDFACPLIDSLEGVTHALRTIEYRDRNPQYQWFITALDLRPVHVWDFSRLNFIYTLLSKRKLTWFVEERFVSGWDDPRFPTVRGIRRRGLSIQALRSFIIAQGASQRDLMLEWDKLWAINKKVIDPVAPRHTAISTDKMVKLIITDGDRDVPTTITTKTLPKHKKNPDVGTKITSFSPLLYIEQQDAQELAMNEEFTLMDWGNALVQSIQRSSDSSSIESISIILHLDGDFKKTKKKLTWLSATPTTDPTQRLIPITLFDYDYLITKKKLEENDDVKDYLTPVTEFRTHVVGDANLRLVKQGDVVQLERKGYYICDKEYAGDDDPMHLIFIPDGKVSSLASKAAVNAEPASKESGSSSKKSDKAAKKNAKASATNIKMYSVVPVYGSPAAIDVEKASNMYKMDSVYGNQAPIATNPVSAPQATSSSASENKSANKPAKSKTPAKPSAAVSEDEPLFNQVDIVVGKIESIQKHPNADTLYVSSINTGLPTGPITVVSGLVKFVPMEELAGSMVVVVCNLKPVGMRGIVSHGMVLCGSNEDHTVVEALVPPPGSCVGDRVYLDGQVVDGKEYSVLNPKKGVWENVQKGLRSDDVCGVEWNGVKVVTKNGQLKTKSLIQATIR